MRTRLNILLLGSFLLLSVVAAFPHHPFPAEFDRTKTVKITGTVTKVEWMKPHTLIQMDVKDTSGKVTKWTVEMGSPDALTKTGWTRDSLKAGHQITVEGWQAKDKSKRANAKSVTITLNAASSFAGDKPSETTSGS